MQIGIKYNDNDFCNTFYGVLNVLLLSYRHCGGLPTDKINLAIMVNELIVGCYLVY